MLVQDVTRDPDLKLAGLSIWAEGRQFPQCDDFWDGNWLNIRVHVEAPGAFVKIAGPWLRSDDIARFTEELATLHRDLRGHAELTCIEPMLRAKVVCNAGGHIEVTIDVTPDLWSQSYQFKFFIDQTYLDGPMSECHRLLERFPVKGDPANC